MYQTKELDLYYAFSRTKYQREFTQDQNPVVDYVHKTFLETPIPETQYLHVIEKATEAPKPPEPKVEKPKPAPAPEQAANQMESIIAKIRAAQGLTGESEGPKRGVYVSPFDNNPVPTPLMRENHNGTNIGDPFGDDNEIEDEEDEDN